MYEKWSIEQLLATFASKFILILDHACNATTIISCPLTMISCLKQMPVYYYNGNNIMCSNIAFPFVIAMQQDNLIILCTQHMRACE